MAAAVVLLCLVAGEIAAFVGMSSALAGASAVVQVDWMAFGCALFVIAAIAVLVDRGWRKQ